MRKPGLRLAFLFSGALLSGGEEPAPASGGSSSFSDVTKKVGDTIEALGIELYGHFKLDMSHDTAETNFGNTASFVKNYPPGAEREELNITARHSRLGLNWRGPEFEGITAFGKLEFDFMGKADQPNTEAQELQAAPRLRHAYMKFDLASGWSLLAGQTWDLFAPLQMQKLNTNAGWGQGNIGYRRPLAGLTKIVTIGDRSDLALAFAVARPVARDYDGGGRDDGEASGAPDLQTHAGLTLPFLTTKPLAVGAGGFFGWRKIDANGTTIPFNKRYEAYGGCLDFSVPILENLTFFSEAWLGRGLDGYRGGIWQSYSVDNGRVQVIYAWGAFGNLVWFPFRKWRLSVGAGIDDPVNADLHSSSEKSSNNTLFANIVYNFYKGASVGAEYDRMDTDYVSRTDRINHRVQASFMLKF